VDGLPDERRRAERAGPGPLTAPAIRVVLFDYDGVVLPPSDFTRVLRREHGIDREQLRSFFDAEEWHRCLVGDADLERELAPHLETWGWPGTPAAFLRMAFEQERDEDPRLLRVIRKLRSQGLRCALASNQERIRGSALAERLGRARIFDDLFLSFELRARKPEATFYERVGGELGEPGCGLLFFDDREENVAAARACGWNAERFTGFEAFRAQLEAYSCRLGSLQLDLGLLFRPDD